jgi:hypothetical protein
MNNKERSSWIAVEKKLPKTYATVLVYGISSNEFLSGKNVYYGFRSLNQGWMMWDPNGINGLSNIQVSHWRPLPKPPKKG